jgi:beta-lactam-binding protein with PASTA domain
VPNVVGRHVERAVRTIVPRDCAVGRITRMYSPARKSFVIAQAPHAQMRLREGARINLIVSKGRRR